MPEWQTPPDAAVRALGKHLDSAMPGLGIARLHGVAELALGDLMQQGWVLIEPTDDHVVEFTTERWAMQHSARCREAGRLLDCNYQQALLADHADGLHWPVGRFVMRLHPRTLADVLGQEPKEGTISGTQADYVPTDA